MIRRLGLGLRQGARVRRGGWTRPGWWRLGRRIVESICGMRIICLRRVKSVGMDCVLWNGCGRRVLGCPKASCARRWLRQGRGKGKQQHGRRSGVEGRGKTKIFYAFLRGPLQHAKGCLPLPSRYQLTGSFFSFPSFPCPSPRSTSIEP